MSNTKYKTVLMAAGSSNCDFYDEPRYSIRITLEENLETAIKSLRYALSHRRAGELNQEYFSWCKKNLKEAVNLIRKAELA